MSSDIALEPSYVHARKHTNPQRKCMSKSLDSQLPRATFSKMKLEGLSLMPQVFDDFQFLSA
jgi:hypothetical protein